MSAYADKASSTPVDDRQNTPRRDFAKHPAVQRSGLSRLPYVFITKGQTTRTAYDVTLGVPLVITDANGAPTTYGYDSFGRLLDVYRPGDAPGDASQHYYYSDVAGGVQLTPFRISETRKPASLKLSVRHFYDGLGRELQTHTGVSVTVSGSAARVDVLVSRRYDALGRVISETAPYTVSACVSDANVNPYTTTNAAAAPRTTTTYDALGRVIDVTAPDGTLTHHAYSLDTTGTQGYTPTNLPLHIVIDGNSHGTHYVSDALGQLIVVRELTGTIAPRPLYAETKYAYDVLGHLTRVTDTLSNRTVITYNVLGQKTGMIDPDMGAWRYQYDHAGNLITQTDALNRVLWFKYDALNRLLEKRQTNSSGSLLGSYTYDIGANGKGQRTSLSDPSGSASWTYDTRGRVLTDTQTITGAGTFASGFGYDALDRVITTTYPMGEVITQTYNAQGLLENLRSKTYGQWYAPNLDYNANGSLALLQLGNILNTTYTYWPLNFRLKQIQIGSLVNLNYGYDPVGNVTKITDTVNSSQVQSFTYDALDRLLSASTTSVGNGPYNQSYAYNPIGNLTAKGGATLYYSNTLHKHAVSAVITAGQTLPYLYDANGNMTQRVELSGTQRLTYTQAWDAENRLKTVTNTVTNRVSRFIYDGDGARVLQIQISGTQVITTAYAGSLEVQITATQRITKTYYSAGAQLIAERVYTSPTNSVLYFLHSDHLGSTSLTTNASGGVVARQLYDAWGNVRYVTGTPPTDIGFTSQRLDSTGLMYYGARYYSSALGRFLSADTIVPEPGNPQSLNRLSYVQNNPLKYIDPTGHCEFTYDADGKRIGIKTFDCSLDKFNALTWDERSDWVDFFMKETGVNKFNNIKGILAYFATDKIFSTSDWAKLSDAGVLLAINDGWRLYGAHQGSGSGIEGFKSETGNVADLWEDFFSAATTGKDPTAFSKWGVAEQAGVDYGIRIAEPLAGKSGGIKELIQIGLFVSAGNIYRAAVSNDVQIPSVTTPENSGAFAFLGSSLVVTPISDNLYGLMPWEVKLFDQLFR